MPAGAGRRWGWHRLERTWARRLVAESGVGAGDLVLDIGAGDGAITHWLVASGAKVIAVERHARRAAALRARFGDDVTVIEADACDVPLPRRAFHVVASPPFAITSALLRRLLQRESALSSATLILDHRAALRWGRPGAPAQRSWRSRFTVTIGAAVPPHAFRPPPSVGCRTVSIERILDR